MKDNKSGIRESISLAGSGKNVPVMDLVRNDPSTAAMMSKLIVSREKPGYNMDGTRKITTPDTMMFRNVSDRLINNIQDSETIMQLLPDVELSSQILIASILSPKDMMTQEVNYVPPSDILPPDVSSAVLNLIKTYFEQTYKIKPLMSEILKDMLFRTGSYPLAVIPENSLDAIINGNASITMESVFSYTKTSDGSLPPTGILGPGYNETSARSRYTTTNGISLENLNVSINQGKEAINHCKIALWDTNPQTSRQEKHSYNTHTYVTDNIDILKIPELNAKVRQQYLEDKIGLRNRAFESISLKTTGQQVNKLNDAQIAGLVYKEKQSSFKPLNILQTQEQLHRRAIGEPLVLRLPSESVIPVHVPGAPEKQIGYFVLIDSEGNPLSRFSVEDNYRRLSSKYTNTNMNTSFPQAMNERVEYMMGGKFENGLDWSNAATLQFAARAYGEMIEADLLARLRNGIYGNGAALGKNEEVYRIMLARALQKENTQLLFIPVELMTYFAFKYDDEGVGRSLIDDMRVVLSLRIWLMFADMMASIRNSIGRTEVKIKLDEDDPDPRKTIDVTQHEMIRSRQQYFPFGMNNSPSDITDWLQRGSYEFTFEGHPGLPDVKVDFGEKNTNYVKPDTELRDNLRKQSIMGFYLTPENVDAGFNAEFAQSIINNNILLSKRVLVLQEKFTPQLSSHAQKMIYASQPLSEKIIMILQENIDKIRTRFENEGKDTEGNSIPDVYIIKRVFHDFIDGLELKLPSPNSVTLENQMLAFETMNKSLDAFLPSYIDTSFFNDATGGEVAANVDTIKAVIKAKFVRDWISNNGVMPELSKLTATDEEGKPMIDFFEEQSAHLEALTKSLSSLMVKLQPKKDEVKSELEEAGVTGGSSYSSSSESTSEETGTDSDEENPFGENPFGEDSGTGESGTTNEETTETTETPEGGEASGTTEATPPEGEENKGTGEEEKPANL